MGYGGYRDLRVWHGAMELVEEVYRMTRTLPSTELYGLSAQCQRAAVSVVSNIAEGAARAGVREFSFHLNVARGSLAELETQLELTRRLGYVPDRRAAELLQKAESVGRQLHALQARLASRGSAPTTKNQQPTTAPCHSPANR